MQFNTQTAHDWSTQIVWLLSTIVVYSDHGFISKPLPSMQATLLGLFYCCYAHCPNGIQYCNAVQIVNSCLLTFDAPASKRSVPSVWTLYIPANVMPQGGEDVQIMGILTQNTILCQNPHHGACLDVRIRHLSQGPLLLLLQNQCQNNRGSIKQCQNPKGWITFLSESPGLPIVPTLCITLTGTLDRCRVLDCIIDRISRVIMNCMHAVSPHSIMTSRFLKT